MSGIEAKKEKVCKETVKHPAKNQEQGPVDRCCSQIGENRPIAGTNCKNCP
jgi:hypothetical protein